MQDFSSESPFLDYTSASLTLQSLEELLSSGGNIQVAERNGEIVISGFKSKKHVLESVVAANIKLAEMKSDPSPIERLSSDCLARIFCYLPVPTRLLTVERVCKRWREISTMGWPDVRYFNIDNFKESAFHRKVFENVMKRCGRFLQYLKVVVVEDERVLLFVHRHCKALQTLHVMFIGNFEKSGKNIAIPHCNKLLQIFKQCPQLTELLLFTPSNFPWVRMKDFQRSNQLSKLILYASDGEKPETVFKLSVDMSRLRSLTDLEIYKYTIDSLVGFEQLQNLKRFTLYECTIAVSVANTITKLINLEQLTLNEIKGITDDLFIDIMRNCEKIRSLKLIVLDDLTDRSFEEIAKLPALESLTIDCVDNVTDTSILKMLYLKSFECSNCNGLTGDGLVHLLKFGSNLTHFTVNGRTPTREGPLYIYGLVQKRKYSCIISLSVTEEVKKWAELQNFSSFFQLHVEEE